MKTTKCGASQHALHKEYHLRDQIMAEERGGECGVNGWREEMQTKFSGET